MFIVDKKKPKKKRLPSFLRMFSKVQHLKGLMTFGENQKRKAVEISRSDADRYNSSFAVKMANFGTLTELCTARKEECPQILNYCIKKQTGLSTSLFYHRLESGSGATFANTVQLQLCELLFLLIK